MSLTITQTTDNGWNVLVVAGDVDLYTTPQLRSALAEALEEQVTGAVPAAVVVAGDSTGVEHAAGGPVQETPAEIAVDGVEPVAVAAVLSDGLVVDLGAVPFMDSAGLGVLIAAYKHARAAQVVMRLSGLSSQVAMLMRITGMARVFDIHATTGTATQRGLVCGHHDGGLTAGRTP